MHQEVKLTSNDKKRHDLVSELNPYWTKLFTEKLLTLKSLYEQTSLFRFFQSMSYDVCDYIKEKHDDKAQLCFIDIDSL